MLSTRRLFASRVAVLLLAIVSSYFALVELVDVWTPSSGQDSAFGIRIDAQGRVAVLDPQYASKGVRLGDPVDLAAMSFNDRLYLWEDVPAPPGTTMTLKTTRDGKPRNTTLEAVPTTYYSDDVFSVYGLAIVTMAYVLVGVILVWSRPNLMLWSLAVFLIRTHAFLFYCGNFRSPPIAALIVFGFAVVHSIGWPGLIIFADRFPDNRTTPMTKYCYVIAVVFFLFYMFEDIYIYVPMFTARPIPELPGWSFWPSTVTACSVFFVLSWKLLRTKGRSQWRGFQWVVAGYFISIPLGLIGANLLFASVQMSSDWPYFGKEVLMLALPVSVAYAIIRHRAFDLGYLTNRTIVYGAFAFVAVSTIVISVWVASRLTSSIGIGVAMFVALLSGMTIRSSRASIVRLVDRVFLRRRYETAISLERIRDALRGSNDPKRLTDEVATTLGLASLAVFSRAADGGFVRNAAFGWPPGSAWHLLPEEALTRTLDDGGASILRVSDDDDDISLPEADARPRFALAVMRGNRVERAIFIGPQRNGASLDRDAMRSLHGVFDEASFA